MQITDLKQKQLILLNLDHTKGRLDIGGIGQGMETKNLYVVYVLNVLTV
jgi:hypothetical protein